MPTKKIKRRRVYVGKGLDNKTAWRKAFTKATADFRGMRYNKETGWASLI